jgi:hypothetical protein
MESLREGQLGLSGDINCGQDRMRMREERGLEERADLRSR